MRGANIPLVGSVINRLACFGYTFYIVSQWDSNNQSYEYSHTNCNNNVVVFNRNKIIFKK